MKQDITWDIHQKSFQALNGYSFDSWEFPWNFQMSHQTKPNFNDDDTIGKATYKHTLRDTDTPINQYLNAE